ncbi:MAG: hypothetical protein HY319_10780 [Armatimonadetes bacterium]|nr:hypothetical protein [Armatimonadota bacterium]
MGILSRDTDPAAERRQLEVLRQIPRPARARMVAEMVRSCHCLTRAGLRLRKPGATDEEVALEAATIWLGPELSQQVSGHLIGSTEVSAMEPFEITAIVVAVLDDLGIEYLVGGSLASSVHGEPRATRDADLVAELSPEQCAPLAERLEDQFYVSLPAMQEAVRRRSSFNAVHLRTGFKIDVFVSKRRPFDLSRFSRRLDIELEGRRFLLPTAEDALLAKLDWYRLGNQVSEQQWRDILGILAVQGDGLDLEYLERWAAVLGLEDLLARARRVSRG